MDSKKAFDSIEFVPLFNALENKGIDPSYANMLLLLSNCTLARSQATIISNIGWSEKGIDIDGKDLCQLEFADDITISAHSPSQLEEILKKLHNQSKPVGLILHLGKANIMLNNQAKPPTK